MQWIKSAMVVSSVVFVAAFAAEGCSSGGGSNKDASSDSPITPADAKTDHVTPPPGDSGCTPGSGLSCETCDLSAYTPPSMGVATLTLNACTNQQMTDFVTACASSTATTATCQAWFNQDTGACAKCLTPNKPTDAAWSAGWCDSQQGPCPFNSGGCVDLITKTVNNEKAKGGAGSCGDLITSAFDCQLTACSACTAQSDFTACSKSAEAAECVAEFNAYQSTTGACASLLAADGPAPTDVCFPQTDADVVKLLNIFCGTGQ